LVNAMDTKLIISRLESFEGRVPHMYVCTGGEVTIGIGHAIQTPAAAPLLKWSVDGRPATDDEIRSGYARVAAAGKGHTAVFYAPLSPCRMADADIDALVSGDVEKFEASLATALPNWSRYPAPAQAALFDMAFNLGLGGLKKFPNMLAAVDAGQWDAAAAQCHRQGIAETRNQQTAELFRRAALAGTAE
jgi:GH24 family phage-related lysozyme (muramidase)